MGRVSKLDGWVNNQWVPLATNILYQPVSTRPYAWLYGNGLARLVTLDTDGRVSKLETPTRHCRRQQLGPRVHQQRGIAARQYVIRQVQEISGSIVWVQQVKRSTACVCLLLTWTDVFGLTTVKTTECYFVKQASIRSSNSSEAPDNLAAANSGHSLSAGNHLVLVVREHERTEKMIDSGVFTKLTVQLPCTDIKTCRDIGVVATKVTYLTHGGTAWVGNGSFSTAQGFDIEMGFVARQSCGVKITGSAIAVSRTTNTRQEHNIALRCTPGVVGLADLTPWVGKAGNNVSAFNPEDEPAGSRVSDKERSCMRE